MLSSKAIVTRDTISGPIELHHTSKNLHANDAVSPNDATDSCDNCVDALSPAGGFAILTRSDADSDSTQFEDLDSGEALIIRKADGRASDEAIESLVLSHKLLGTRKWIVIHYIGDEESPLFDHEATGKLLEQSRFSAIDGGEAMSSRPRPGQSTEEWEDAWIKFWQAASHNLGQVADIIREDVARIRAHPRTPADVAVEGYIRDVKLGSFLRV